MTSKQRLLTALDGKQPDRLPVTTHHLMKYYLDRYEGGIDGFTFHQARGFDPIIWALPILPDEAKGQYLDPETGILCSSDWRVEMETLPDSQYRTVRYRFFTPGGTLETVLQGNNYTDWVCERLIRKKSDIELLAAYAPHPRCDVAEVNRVAEEFGERALIRGNITCFQPYGQPGCWQDLSCLYGIEELILETYDDPEWVKAACHALQSMKMTFIRSLTGARYDLLELGGGDASTTVISPAIFREFVAPFDMPLIQEAHTVGQRIVYHTCGGMMPILEDIADMGPNAMETFTPPGMGADVDLAEAKRRIGERVCMIGGFDQGHYLAGCMESDTRKAVRACFEAAGAGGGFILSPSDHFFDAEESLIRAFVEEAQSCVY